MSRPRVLLVTPDFPPEFGGIQKLFHRLVENAHGLDFRVLTLGQKDGVAFDRTTEIGIRRIADSGIDRRIAGLALNAASMQEVRRFRPDVVLSGHPVVSLGAIAMRKTLRVPMVQYVHADEFRVRARITAMATRTADLTIAVSSYTKGMAVAAGVDPSRVQVIHPGVDLPPDRRRPDRSDGPPTLLTVAGLLFRYKGHAVLTRAMPLIRARVPDARWIVIGGGTFKPALESLVAAYGLTDAVSILGRVDDEIRDEWLNRADVFVLPSRVPPTGTGGEGFGIAYLEAAAHRLPSVGGDAGGAVDAVVDGETGMLVDATDHLAGADATAGLLSDPVRAREMGSAARGWAEQHAWPKVAVRVERAILETLARR